MSDARRADVQPDFTAGFASRHELAAHILAQAFAPRERDFAPSDIKQRAGGRNKTNGPVGFAPQETGDATPRHFAPRSEEHTSELQSLMRISYAVFCLKKNKQ